MEASSLASRSRGESPEDTAIREVKEETGLRVAAGEVIGERVHPKTGRTMIYVAAKPTAAPDVFVGDKDELAEVRWVSLAEADELTGRHDSGRCTSTSSASSAGQSDEPARAEAAA